MPSLAAMSSRFSTMTRRSCSVYLDAFSQRTAWPRPGDSHLQNENNKLYTVPLRNNTDHSKTSHAGREPGLLAHCDLMLFLLAVTSSSHAPHAVAGGTSVDRYGECGATLALQLIQLSLA